MVSMIVISANQSLPSMSLAFEIISAIATVGMSTGITRNLGVLAKIIIITLMYLGRVGPLTVVLSITRKKRNTGIKYPEGKILIG